MAFQDVLTAETDRARTDESDDGSETTTVSNSDPFSQGYDLSDYQMDQEAVDTVLNVTVALTHLL